MSDSEEIAKKNSLKQQIDLGKWKSEVRDINDKENDDARHGKHAKRNDTGESGAPITLSIEKTWVNPNASNTNRKRRRINDFHTSAARSVEITTASNFDEVPENNSPKLGVVTPCFQKGAVRDVDYCDSADKIRDSKKPPRP